MVNVGAIIGKSQVLVITTPPLPNRCDISMVITVMSTDRVCVRAIWLAS